MKTYLLDEALVLVLNGKPGYLPADTAKAADYLQAAAEKEKNAAQAAALRAAAARLRRGLAPSL